MVVQSVNRWDKVQNSTKSCELTCSDILISSIVWFKVYLPNKQTSENSVKKLGPENQLISRKIQYCKAMNEKIDLEHPYYHNVVVYPIIFHSVSNALVRSTKMSPVLLFISILSKLVHMPYLKY